MEFNVNSFQTFQEVEHKFLIFEIKLVILFIS